MKKGATKSGVMDGKVCKEWTALAESQNGGQTAQQNRVWCGRTGEGSRAAREIDNDEGGDGKQASRLGGGGSCLGAVLSRVRRGQWTSGTDCTGEGTGGVGWAREMRQGKAG